MADTCRPPEKAAMNTIRIYYALIPALLFIFALEAVYVIVSIPDNLGTALSTVGRFPSLAKT